MKRFEIIMLEGHEKVSVQFPVHSPNFLEFVKVGFSVLRKLFRFMPTHIVMDAMISINFQPSKEMTCRYATRKVDKRFYSEIKFMEPLLVSYVKEKAKTS